MTITDADYRLQESASGAEFAIIGACFVGDAAALNYVMQEVDEDHFVERKNKLLFQVIKRMHKIGVPIEVTTVSDHFTAHEKKIIGMAEVVEAIEKVGHVSNVRHYATIMRNRAITNEINKQYSKLIADPFNEEAQKEVSKLWDKLKNDGHSVVSLQAATLTYNDTIERRRGGREFRIVTGYGNLDKMLGGFSCGNLIAVGARTSLGKTSLLLNFALKFLQQKMRVLFVSAEMVTDEILDRMVSMDADLPISQLRRGHVQDEDLKRVNKSLEKFHELPMWFLEGGKMSMTRLRQAIEATNPTVVFVDFIQRFVPPNPAMNRAAYFSDLANELKAIAMNKKMVIFAASQLSRDIEKDNQGKGRAPSLSDFKESGGIEEAADIAMLLQAQKKEETSEQKKIIVHILKHRNGPTGTVPFQFIKARTMFFEEEEDPAML